VALYRRFPVRPKDFPFTTPSISDPDVKKERHSLWRVQAKSLLVKHPGKRWVNSVGQFLQTPHYGLDIKHDSRLIPENLESLYLSMVCLHAHSNPLMPRRVRRVMRSWSAMPSDAAFMTRYWSILLAHHTIDRTWACYYLIAVSSSWHWSSRRSPPADMLSVIGALSVSLFLCSELIHDCVISVCWIATIPLCTLVVWNRQVSIWSCLEFRWRLSVLMRCRVF